ncbi:hypothetical protein Tco_0648481 [Tanacetum coccineum]
MDNPNITMEEYIRLEEEKARRRGKVYNWKTAKCGKIWYDEDVHDLRFIETEFPAMVLNDELSSGKKKYSLVNSWYVLLTIMKLALEYRLTNSMMKITRLREVNIVTWNYLVNGMLLNLIKILYVPFGIPFDPKRYYKDGVYTRMLQRPRSIQHMALPLRDQRHQYLRFMGLWYTDTDIADFEERLGSIYDREVHRVQVFDFGGLTELMDERLRGMGLHTTEEIESVGFGAYWAESARQILDKGDLSAYLIGISSAKDFLDTTPSYTSIRYPMVRLCHRMITCSIAGRSQAPEKVTVTDLFYLRGMYFSLVNIPYLLARYLRLFTSWRKRGAMISGGQFVARLAEHFRLLTEEMLQGLAVIVAPGPERQQVVAAGAPEAVEDALVVDEGALAVSAPVVEEEVHKIRGALGEQHKVMDVMARGLSRFIVWAAEGISHLLDSAGATYDLAEKKLTMLVKYLQSGNLKVLSLEISRQLFNTILLINSSWRIYRAKYQGCWDLKTSR